MNESIPTNNPSPIRRAISDFLEQQLDVYRRAPSRIKRDANSAAETTRDHVGRWFFELIQNADDAKATRLIIGDNGFDAENGSLLKLRSPV